MLIPDPDYVATCLKNILMMRDRNESLTGDGHQPLTGVLQQQRVMLLLRSLGRLRQLGRQDGVLLLGGGGRIAGRLHHPAAATRAGRQAAPSSPPRRLHRLNGPGRGLLRGPRRAQPGVHPRLLLLLVDSLNRLLQLLQQRRDLGGRRTASTARRRPAHLLLWQWIGEQGGQRDVAAAA